jgi:alkanesulfonate monooxygenase SsuD/methylene tetrahydromethanopterin reductase-like flavin-dependent oxidoreductase (luciferase family)
MLEATLPYVDAWNIWYAWYANVPERFAEANRRVDEASERVGRDPRTISRSACVLVVLDRAAGERPLDPEISALEGPAERLVAGLRDFAAAGADEVILVVSPITERSIRTLGESIALLDKHSST